MEVLPDRKSLEAALALRRRRDAHAALPWFRRIFTAPPSSGEGDGGSLSREPGLGTMLAVLDLGRRPVCLFCGGVSVEPLALDIGGGGGGDAPVPPTPLGRAHPSCGGALSARWSGRNDRIAPAEITRVYDIRGRLVSREPGWRRPVGA